MQPTDDNALLREYAEKHSDTAFAALVARHINLVYSVALRCVGNAHAAEEVTQAVFIILAKKAPRLRHHRALSSWLFQTTRLTAGNFLRGEIRRQRREQEAYMQSTLNESADEPWPHLTPLLDAAVARLGEKDRRAILLRFYEGKNLREVGVALGAGEAAAEKRVGRAIEKLRKFFGKRGLTLSAAAIAATASAHSVHAAPAGLAASVSALAAAKGATASASTLTLIKGALKIMAWTKAKTAIVVGVAALLAAGTTTTLVIHHQNNSRTYISSSSWTAAGYGDPASTLRTFLWAVRKDDAKAMFDCLSPDCQEAFRQLAAQVTDAAPDQYMLGLLRPGLSSLSAIRIVKTETVANDQVILDISHEGSAQIRNTLIQLRKIGGDWKLDDFDPKGSRGRTGVSAPNAEFGGIGVALGTDDKTHVVNFNAVLPGSPAEEAGLSAKLVVLKVDDVSMRGKTMAECANLIRGKVGTKVRLELLDPDTKETNTVELTRRKLGP